MDGINKTDSDCGFVDRGLLEWNKATYAFFLIS